MSADNPVSLLNDVVAILSHVARISSEYVSVVTQVLRTEQGELTLWGKLPFLDS